MNVDGMSLQSSWGVDALLHTKDIDIFGVSETHFRADIPKERYHYDNYHVWHCDREGASKWGGGLSIYYRDHLSATPYTPSVPSELEYVSRER